LRVLAAGPRWRAALAGPPIVRPRPRRRVRSSLRIIARPGADLAARLGACARHVGRAVERLLGLDVRTVSVLVDGVGS
jgi:hypothetical protein